MWLIRRCAHASRCKRHGLAAICWQQTTSPIGRTNGGRHDHTAVQRCAAHTNPSGGVCCWQLLSEPAPTHCLKTASWLHMHRHNRRHPQPGSQEATFQHLPVQDKPQTSAGQATEPQSCTKGRSKRQVEINPQSHSNHPNVLTSSTPALQLRQTCRTDTMTRVTRLTHCAIFTYACYTT